MSSQFTFPSPIGGVPFESDFVPSIIFAVFYALLVAAVFWRIISPKSRNFVIIGTIAFAIERVVIFGLRAEEARVPAKRTSNNLTIYMQTTLSIGYISIAADLLLLLRCLTTAATLSAARTVNMFTRSPEPGLKPLSSVGSTFPTTAQDIIDERAKERKGYRDINGLLQLLYWIPFALGTVAGIMYIKAETDASKAQLVQQLRYATGATSCLMVTSVQIFACYAATSIRGIRRKPTWLIFSLATLLNVISVYRIVVMRLQTTSLTSMAPGSLNSTQSKITFYTLHMVPEWLTAAILLSMNLRQVFGTGLWGDQFRPQEKDLLEKGRQ